MKRKKMMMNSGDAGFEMDINKSSSMRLSFTMTSSDFAALKAQLAKQRMYDMIDGGLACAKGAGEGARTSEDIRALCPHSVQV